MPNTIQIAINNIKTPSVKSVLLGSGNAGKPLIIPSESKALYSILDTTTGRAPHNILVKREGKNLTIAFQKNSKPDVIIEDFYDKDSAGLVGLAENQEYYYYVPETGQKVDFIPNLTTNSPAEWHALGPVDALAGADFPWAWVGGLLGLGAIAAGMGGGGSDEPVNHPASVTPDSKNMSEDSTTPATGQVTITDEDTGENTAQPQTNTAGAHGTFSINAAGSWSYHLNNTDPAVQALRDGQTITETFTVKSADGSASNTVTVVITGINDVATVTPDTQTLTEDSSVPATGKLTVTDADTDEGFAQAQTNTAGAHGTFSIDASGNWSYQLNNSDPVVQGLHDAQTITETFTVNSLDNSTSNTVTVVITGINDIANVTPDTQILTEDSTTPATGKLTVTDADTDESFVQPQTNTAGTHGSFSIDASGNWSYQLNNSDPVVQALQDGQTLTETFVVNSLDGSANNTATVIITGIDDAAALSINPNAAIVETWYENILNEVVNTGAADSNPIKHALSTLGLTITDVDGAGINGYTLTISENSTGWLIDESGNTLTGPLSVHVTDQASLDTELAKYFYQPRDLALLSDHFIPDAPFAITLTDNGRNSSLEHIKVIEGQIDNNIHITEASSQSFTGELNDIVVVESSATNGAIVYSGDGSDKINLLAAGSAAFSGNDNDAVCGQSTELQIATGAGNDAIYVLENSQAVDMSGGTGADGFWFSANISQAISSNSNYIQDFDVNVDKLNFFDVIDLNSDTVFNLNEVVASVTFDSTYNRTDIQLIDGDHDGLSAHIILENVNVASISALSNYVDTIMGTTFTFATI